MIVVKKEKKWKLPFYVYDFLGVKLLTRLILQFSNLNKHEFKHDFGDTFCPMCECDAEIENTEQFLLCCSKIQTLQ